MTRQESNQQVAEVMAAILQQECAHVVYDHLGCYCGLIPQDPPVYGDKFKKVKCGGMKNEHCVKPGQYTVKRRDERCHD